MEQLKRLFSEKKGLSYMLVAVLVAAVAFWGYRLFFADRNDVLSTEALSEDVTVLFTDTGDTRKMARGDIVRELLDRDGNTAIDPSNGITNPKTGKQTGVIVSDGAWKKLIEGVNRERSFKGKPIGQK